MCISYIGIQPNWAMLWLVKWKCDQVARLHGVSWDRFVRWPTYPTKFWPFCPFPFLLISQAYMSYMSRRYHTFEQLQSILDEVRCQTKMQKITFVLDVYKVPTIFMRISWPTWFSIHRITVVWGIIMTFKRHHQIKGWRDMAMWPICPAAHLAPVSLLSLELMDSCSWSQKGCRL